MPQKINELNEWINWNYIGLAAGILSVIVTIYNINHYVAEIRKK